jgi:hypothetical protein
MSDGQDDPRGADRALMCWLSALPQRRARMQVLLARADQALGVQFGDIEGLLALRRRSAATGLRGRLACAAKRMLRGV